MKRQKRKQDALILKMLPKEVVEKLNSGADIAENFESATLFFSSVVDFAENEVVDVSVVSVSVTDTVDVDVDVDVA